MLIHIHRHARLPVLGVAPISTSSIRRLDTVNACWYALCPTILETLPPKLAFKHAQPEHMGIITLPIVIVGVPALAAGSG